MTSDVFHLEGKTAVVATMHGKQAVIEPVLATFGLRFLAPPVIDTDRFGTFTRDIERAGTQREALLAKARAGLEHAPDADFCVSSEGGFGPHPQVPFAVAGFEMVALLARRTGQAIIGRHLTTTTNFITRLREGRPCEGCETPTLDAWFEEYRCAACGHASQRIIDPDRRAEPRHCSRCNP